MAALINTIQINYYKQQCQRTQRTNHVCAYSEVRSVVSQPKCNLIQVFSWILDDGRAPATGIRRVNLERKYYSCECQIGAVQSGWISRKFFP